MNSQRVYELTDCTEYRQTLLAKPPRLVRATSILLATLVAAALFWAAVTEADLVVRAPGRVRPMVRSASLPDAAAEESLISPLLAGRVVEVHVREGDQVRKGDILVRMEAERLRNDIARQRQLIQSAEIELEKLDQTKATLEARFQTARAAAAAELAEAEEKIENARQRRQSAILLQKVALELAEDERQRLEKVAARTQAVGEADLVQAAARCREAKLKLQQAQLPVDLGRLRVLQQAVELVEKQHAVECIQLDTRRQTKASGVAAARLQLANLEWELQQSELRAPSDATVTSLDVAVGDVVEAGQKVLALAQQCGFRIDVAVTSQDVGQLREGMPVRVKLDAYDYQKYGSVAGKVIFVAPDSQIQADAAPQAPAYTVKIVLAEEQVGRGRLLGEIKLGMTGVAEIVTDRESILMLLVRSIRQSISLA